MAGTQGAPRHRQCRPVAHDPGLDDVRLADLQQRWQFPALRERAACTAPAVRPAGTACGVDVAASRDDAGGPASRDRPLQMHRVAIPKGSFDAQASQ